MTESHQQEHFGQNFHAFLDVSVCEGERRPARPAPWVNDNKLKSPNILFSSQIEQDECVDNFGKN